MRETKYDNNNGVIRKGLTQRLGAGLRAFHLTVLALGMAWSFAAGTATAQIFGGNPLQLGGSGWSVGLPIILDPQMPPLLLTGMGDTVVYELYVTGPASDDLEVQYANALSFGSPSQWITLTNFVLGTQPYVVVDESIPWAQIWFVRVLAQAAPPPEPQPDPARWSQISPGTFLMGSPETEYDRSTDEGPQTQVTLTRGFWIGRFEVTQGEYTAVAGTNHSTFTGDPSQPVEQVSWYDASNYCALLTRQEQDGGRLPAGYEYRLPTEAEWEYVARAGTTNRFFFGDDHSYTELPNYAWFNADSGGTTHDVGTRQSNQWGLYDTSGNVFEWCADWYGPYPGSSVTDPAGPSTGVYRVMRGGSWRFPGGDARSAARNFNVPDFASYGIGIRVVLSQTR